MTITVQQLAAELGVTPEDVYKAVDDLEESIVRHATHRMTDDLAAQVRRHVGASAPEETPTKETEVKRGVIRRRVVRGADEEESAPAAPAVRRRVVKAADEASPAPEPAEAAPATEPAAVAEAADEGTPVRRRARMATVVTARPKAADEAPPAEEAVVDTSAEVAAESAAEPEVVEEVPARRPRMATVVSTRRQDETAVLAADDSVDEVPAGVEPEEPARRPRMATVVTRPQEDGGRRGEDLTPMQRAAMARREVDHQAQARGEGAAVVVGTVNPDLLNSRLAFERRDAPRGPRGKGPEEEGAARAKKGKGKRVVQNVERFDKFKRGKKGKQKGAAQQQTRITQAAEHKRVVRMEEAIAVSDLAQQMSVKGGELVAKLAFDLGVKGVSIGTTVDFDTASLLAEMYEYKIEQVGFDITKYLPTYEEDESDLIDRPPVVTVMGHVDHGKTSLLDAIRKTQVTSTEAGGITQHIGAYKVSWADREIAFLDTPGHEAFTALRARGAKATDIVILVVAADDGVMPQTVEAINHAKDAGVPIIVAVNKIDKPGANIERIKQALTEFELVPEAWGGDTIFAEISALQSTGIDELMDMILLQADVLELRANPKRPAQGVVIESRLDVGRGPVATVLVQHGTLRTGDIVVIGQYHGRVRTMIDEFQEQHKVAPPSTPVEITGLSGVPESGETFYAVTSEKDARAIAEHVAVQSKQAELAMSIHSGGGMERIAEMMKAGEMKELKVIVKGDVQGSVEALNQSLRKLATEKVSVRVVHSGVGGVTESDVNLAASNDEGVGVVLIGFNTKIDARAQAAIDQQKVTVIQHSIIYEIIDQVRALMAGLLEPVYVEEYLGKAEIRKLFRVSRVGTVCGCMVLDGVVARNSRVRVTRAGATVLETNIDTLKHFDRDEKEVKSGFECGISLARSEGVEEGDLIECYRLKATQATL